MDDACAFAGHSSELVQADAVTTPAEALAMVGEMYSEQDLAKAKQFRHENPHT